MATIRKKLVIVGDGACGNQEISIKIFEFIYLFIHRENMSIDCIQ
jgi:hypothetical protein